MADHVIAPVTGTDFHVDQPEQRPRAKTDAQRLLEILNRSRTDTWEHERIRLAAEAKERAEAEAKRAAVEAQVREDLEAKRAEASKVTHGIVMPSSPPTLYACPVSGEMVPFAPSTEPPSRGLLPPPPPAAMLIPAPPAPADDLPVTEEF